VPFRVPSSSSLRRYVGLPVLAGLFIALGSGAGCTSQLYCDYPTGQCTEAGGPTEAAVTAVAAGALWAGGGGCKINGCRYPLVCNQGSGFCEYMPCGENASICPAGTTCERTSQTCR